MQYNGRRERDESMAALVSHWGPTPTSTGSQTAFGEYWRASRLSLEEICQEIFFSVRLG